MAFGTVVGNFNSNLQFECFFVSRPHHQLHDYCTSYMGTVVFRTVLKNLKI
jgi:hypothetical protein